MTIILFFVAVILIAGGLWYFMKGGPKQDFPNVFGRDNDNER